NFQAFSVNTFPPRTTLSLHSLPLCEQLLLLFCFSLVAKLVAQLALRRRHLNFEVGISFLTLKKADWVLCNSFYELEKQNDLVHGWGMDMKLGYSLKFNLNQFIRLPGQFPAHPIILHFVEDKTILITGVTGFLAKSREDTGGKDTNFAKRGTINTYLVCYTCLLFQVILLIVADIIGKDLFRLLKENLGPNFNSFIAQKLTLVQGIFLAKIWRSPLPSSFSPSFRDRRYEYKGLNKVWKGKLSEAKASENPMKIQEAQVWIIFISLFMV
ncbi:hypothetical protein HN873_042892, partial [Arachis hypogaea]